MIANMTTKIRKCCIATTFLALVTLLSIWFAFRGPEMNIELLLVAMAAFYGTASSFFAWCHACDERSPE